MHIFNEIICKNSFMILLKNNVYFNNDFNMIKCAIEMKNINNLLWD